MEERFHKLTYSLLYPLEGVETVGFNYSNIPAFSSVALERTVGEHFADCLMPRLFEPLGIVKSVYANCPARHFTVLPEWRLLWKNWEGGYGYFIWKYKEGFRITGKWAER